MVKKDIRFVYGATCSWRGSIQDIEVTGNGLPCCPYCKGVLFEMDSKEVWDAQIEKFEKDGHPGYIKFQEWIGKIHTTNGQCKRITNPIELVEAYAEAGGIEPPGLRGPK